MIEFVFHPDGRLESLLASVERDYVKFKRGGRRNTVKMWEKNKTKTNMAFAKH